MPESGTKADWVIQQIQEHGLGEIAFALLVIGGGFALIGYYIGWRVTLKRNQEEIRKLTEEVEKIKKEAGKIKEEARKTAGENVEKLAKLRQISNEKRETLNIAMGSLRDAIKTRAATDHLRKCRDEACNIYASSYLPALNDYVEMIGTLVDESECLRRAETELLAGLKTICTFLEVANHTELLARIDGSSQFLVRREARDGLFKRVEGLVPLNHALRGELATICARTDFFVRE